MAKFSKDVMKSFSDKFKIIQMLFYIYPVLKESDSAEFTQIKLSFRLPVTLHHTKTFLI